MMTRPRDRAPVLLGIRRLAVVIILLLANGYNLMVGNAYPLSSIGIVAFVAVAQFAPAMLGGLYWRRGNRIGALAGIGVGFCSGAIRRYCRSLPKLGSSRRHWLSMGRGVSNCCARERLSALPGSIH
jgi:Na+/proline symporter